MDQKSSDIFYLFVQRIFEQTSSRELISALLENGFDQWEQTKELDQEMLVDIGIEEKYIQIILDTIQEIVKKEELYSDQSSSANTLSLSVIMTGLNKKKDYSKKQSKFGQSKEQVKKDLLQSVSTLTINSKQLTHLSECIEWCYNLQILHIYQNKLTSLRYLEGLKNLRILYAQDNEISNADSISHLNRLEKIYLDKNCLSRLPLLPENLDTISISNQKISGGFTFIEESLYNSGKSITHIICESNGVVEIQAFRCLQAVRNINLKNNQIQQFDGIEDALANMQSLMEIDLRGNPVTLTPKYRDKVVLLSRSINCLDNKNILQHERQFLINLGRQKILKRQQSLEVGKQSKTTPQLSTEGTGKMIHLDGQKTALISAKGFYEAKVHTNTKTIPRPPKK